jgi:hypothetical protein
VPWGQLRVENLKGAELGRFSVPTLGWQQLHIAFQKSLSVLFTELCWLRDFRIAEGDSHSLDTAYCPANPFTSAPPASVSAILKTYSAFPASKAAQPPWGFANGSRLLMRRPLDQVLG